MEIADWDTYADCKFKITTLWSPKGGFACAQHHYRWLCIHSAPNCSKVWSVRCCLQYHSIIVYYSTDFGLHPLTHSLSLVVSFYRSFCFWIWVPMGVVDNISVSMCVSDQQKSGHSNIWIYHQFLTWQGTFTRQILGCFCKCQSQFLWIHEIKLPHTVD